MLRKQICILSIAVIFLLLGQATAISENVTSLDNGSPALENKNLTQSENNESISYENNESILPANNSSVGFSFAPLNPDFEAYQENKSQNENKLLLSSGELSAFANTGFEKTTGYIPVPVNLSNMGSIKNLIGGGSYPVFYDLRTLGLVSPVQDQMDAGSCWAYGACAALESYLLKTEGKNWDFSENNIKNLLSEAYPEGFDRTYDNGGNSFMTTAYFARWSGPVSEIEDPYDSHSGISPTALPSLKHIQEVIYLPGRSGPMDNDLIKWALMNYGVVDSVIYMSNDSYSTANSTYYYTGSSYPDHEIAIVGWDDSFDRNKFTPAAPGDGAFIVKNSWGTNWGEEGFFYVSYYDTIIGSENSIRPAEDLSSYSHVYQYDPLGWVENIGASGSTAWAANVFTAEENETLEAVSFYTTSPNSSYEIYIYTDPVSGPVNSAGAETSVNGTITFAGYHTVPLNTSVPLEAGQNFSVVVKFTTPGYFFPVAVELPLEDYSSKATANSGESFFSPDGKNWTDTALAIENTNICIKAFTNRSRAPEAAFTSNVTSGPAPFQVGFIDASTFSPTAWYWDFGDGSTSTERYPAHNYTEAGKYNVTLRAENEYGNSTAEKTEWISVTGSSLLYVDANGSANTSGSANFTSIQEAIDAASPGATIIVRNGTYTENVDVDRAVTILSESGPGYTEVKAAKSNDSVFYVTADAVNISGFSISGGSELFSSSSYGTAGVWLYGVKDCNVSENVFSDNYFGLYVIDTENCTLENNTVESNYAGIYLNGAKGTVLRNNRLENNSYNFAFKEASLEQDIDESNTVEGKPIYYLVNESDIILNSSSNAGTVYCIGCRNVTVRDLNLSKNYYGLYLYNSIDSHIENINSSDNNYGIYIRSSSGLNLTNSSTGSNSCGLYIQDSEWNSISGNRMDGNSCNFMIEGECTAQNVPEIESGNLVDGKKLYILCGVSNQVFDAESNAGSIYLLNCLNVTIRDFVLQDEMYGIYLYKTEGLLENNTLSGNDYGVYLEDSENSTVEGNKISNNSYGIYLTASRGNSLANNTMSGSGYGIYLSESGSNTISGNNASGNDIGIHAAYSNNNTFAKNVALDNTLGFYLLGSNDNVLTTNTANLNTESGFDLTISQHNTLSGNTVSENARGITLQGWAGEISTADNILFSNEVSNNSELGIWLTVAENNTIYGNSFENLKNVKDAGHNTWNTTIGNSWSDYTGSDSDGNGVGDTPYVINSLTGSQDYLPICREFGVPLTLHVGSGSGNISSIQAALDAAWEGDTILVSPGTYTENLQVSKSVSIISSEGSDNTIIRAVNPEEDILSVRADSVIFSGFTLAGAYEDSTGIYLEGVSDCNLSGNVLSDNYYGALLDESENCTLSENTITGGRYGIYLRRSGNNTLFNNSVSSTWGYGYGIWLNRASFNEISGNELQNNSYGLAVLYESNGNEVYRNTMCEGTYGLMLESSRSNILRNNSMQNNTYNFRDDLYYLNEKLNQSDIDTSNLVNGKPIYYLVGEADLVLDSTSNAGTVYLIGCENITVRDLNLEKNGFGVFATETSNSTLRNLTISENEYGIRDEFGNKNNCSYNTVENNSYRGIEVYYGENNTLNNNSIVKNFYNGLDVGYGKGNFLNNNSISRSEYGLMLASDSAVLRNNLISDNNYNFGSYSYNESIIRSYDIDTSNLVDGKPIYCLAGESDRVLDNSSNAGTVYLVDCENITVRDQVIKNNYLGIYLYNTSNSNLEGNNLSENYRGFYLEAFFNSSIARSNVNNNDYGLYLYNSLNSNFEGNNLSENYHGFYLEDVFNSSIVRNNVNNNDYGFYLYNISNSSLEGNNVSKNYRGFYLEDVFNSSIVRNNVSNNDYGLYLRATFGNNVYDNFFRNTYNNRVLRGENAGNTWNLSKTEGSNILGGSYIGGNCWANPSGTGFSEITPDEDGDGFCDSPYEIPDSENESDSLPLYFPSNVSASEDEEENGISRNSGGSHAAIYGGISGISSNDVLVSSVSRQQVIADQNTEFSFNEPECGITGISFISGTSAGTVSGNVQILNGLPDTISEAPAGELYQYISIVIGSQFFGESGTFEEASIDFKVPRNWVEENNIDEASLTLNRYHDNTWTQLSTEKTGEDNEFFYFRAETPGFSYYSITGEPKDLTITPANGSETGTEQIPENDVQEPTEKQKSPGFELGFTAIGILSTIYLLKKR